MIPNDSKPFKSRFPFWTEAILELSRAGVFSFAVYIVPVYTLLHHFTPSIGTKVKCTLIQSDQRKSTLLNHDKHQKVSTLRCCQTFTVQFKKSEFDICNFLVFSQKDHSIYSAAPNWTLFLFDVLFLSYVTLHLIILISDAPYDLNAIFKKV